MKRLTNLLAITLLTSCVTAFAQEQEETTTEKSAVEQSADIYAAGYNKFRFGGYGEILANFMDYGINRFRGTDNGSKKDHRNSISIPRFVLAFDYKFNSQWVLGAEIEFEAGGTGSAYEIENTENGEYEMEVEKGGEVALEQFHITPTSITSRSTSSELLVRKAKRPSFLLPGTKTVSKYSVRSVEATHVSTTRLWSLPD